MSHLKQQLHTYCSEHLQQRINEAKEAIQMLQLSANEETKSSAGDKYETGRAMAQLEIEKANLQLAEAFKLKKVLDQISTDKVTSSIEIGSLVITSAGNFYIAVSIGKITLNQRIYYIISSASPLAQKLIGHQVNDSFTFRDKNLVIQEIL